MLEFVYNNAVHSTTGFTPFYLCYGRHPLNLASLLVDIETKNFATENLLKALHQDLKTAIQNIKIAQDRQKHYVDKKCGDLEVEVGDEVLLSVWN